MPQSAERLWKQAGGEGKLENQRLDNLRWGELKPGTRLAAAEIIFPRLDKEKTLANLYRLAEADRVRGKSKERIVMDDKGVKSPSPESRAPSPATTSPSGESPKISIEDFTKVDMRVGEVVSAEPVAGAQKLLKLMVDIGSEVRQVVAGIAGYYQPEELVGMKVVLVVNLQPRKLRGVESNGMIVAASVGEEGRPVLVTFQEDVPKGAKLR
jgi:methionyl-tRNA synthetase